ncbi:LLM class flavin-dependent oxidoreductase [Phyllobacterium leguminum]|nr:LLM class flavin-dependent oxidoreductase [Phyllobacterium leguminum]
MPKVAPRHIEFEERGKLFRQAVEYMREAWTSGGLPLGEGRRHPSLALLPAPYQSAVPMIIAGQGQQSPDWIAQNMDGRFVYPNNIEALAQQAAGWRHARRMLGLDDGVFISAFHLDLADDPHENPTPRRFGARIGRNPLIEHLRALERAGVNHLALLLRPCRRPLPEVIAELAEEVLPHFGKPVSGAHRQEQLSE